MNVNSALEVIKLSLLLLSLLLLLLLLLLLGNLRTTTKFTTTTSVDWERTGTRTSVSAGKRKLKMQSIGSVDDDDTECKQTSRSSRTVMFVRNKVFFRKGVF